MLIDELKDNEKDFADNNRKEDRRHLIYYLKIEDRDSSELVGRVVDITRDGVLVISKERLPENKELHVKIELGSELFQKMNGHLHVTIIPRWSKQDINPNYYVNGCSFENHSEDDRTLVSKLIDFIGFRD